MVRRSGRADCHRCKPGLSHPDATLSTRSRQPTTSPKASRRLFNGSHMVAARPDPTSSTNTATTQRGKCHPTKLRSSSLSASATRLRARVGRLGGLARCPTLKPARRRCGWLGAVSIGSRVCQPAASLKWPILLPVSSRMTEVGVGPRLVPGGPSGHRHANPVASRNSPGLVKGLDWVQSESKHLISPAVRELRPTPHEHPPPSLRAIAERASVAASANGEHKARFRT